MLYPPRCGGCDRRGTLWCEDCYSQVEAPYLDARVGGIEAVASAGSLKGPLREAIHKLKYQGDSPLARPLARLLSEALSNDDPWAALDGNPPVIMPVPLHHKKERARGYNQSALLARELARITGWPLQGGLVRVKETQPQVGLSAEARQRNVAEAFTWQGGSLHAPVLLVDDVCTTGATLSQCAAALRAAGVGQIYAVTVAKAVGGDDLV
jgi:competence protein ComFC